MSRLKDKIAIITGAAKGMGALHAQRFVEEGAKVVIADIADEGKEVADELGENAVFMELDVTDEENWKKVVENTEDTFGPIDILVNNAGIVGSIKPLIEYSTEDYKNVVDVNQVGTFLGMKTVYPSMKKTDNGTIVNVSSAAGITGNPGQIAYDASKFAVRGMTKTAAKEFADDNIRVNSVHPGPIATGIASEEFQEKLAEELPIRKVGEPEEVTHMIVYLASDESTYSTGSEFVVDGGMTA